MDLWTIPLNSGAELTPSQIAGLCDALFQSEIPVETRADWLAALSRRGESASEIAAFVRTLLRRGVAFPADESPGFVMDVCGTGGDKLGFFNISTAVMFIVAACGVRVVKHGNRGITSKSGGADVLEASGVKIDLPPDAAAAVLDQAGCVFLFAPLYHPTFREVAPVRQYLARQGIVTVFNKLGPLLNPARPARQLSGVFQSGLVDLYADVFIELGREVAWAVHGSTPLGGLDELSTLGSSRVCEVRAGRKTEFSLDAGMHGIPTPEIGALAGGDAAENAKTLQSLLAGEYPGALEDIVCWNAAAALVVGGVAENMTAGLVSARKALRDGSAAERLRRMQSVSKSV